MAKRKLRDALGREITYDTDKAGSGDRSMCKRCRFDWKTCENDIIRMEAKGNIVCVAQTDEEGFPILFYCGFFEEKPYSNA